MVGGRGGFSRRERWLEFSSLLRGFARGGLDLYPTKAGLTRSSRRTGPNPGAADPPRSHLQLGLNRQPASLFALTA